MHPRRCGYVRGAVFLALWLAGCGPEPASTSTAPKPTGDRVVARVGEAVITASAVEAELLRRGASVRPEDVVTEWVRFQVVLAKARAAGYAEDPALRAAWERMLVAKFEEDRLGPREAAVRDTSESALRQEYARHPDRYLSPARVRGGVILVRVGAKADPEVRQAMAREAEALRTRAAALEDTAFAALVRERSEDQATRYRGGDAGWLSEGAPGNPWEPEVVQALLALAQPGAVGPVVSTERGFCVVRLIAREPAVPVPFERAREGIRRQLARDAARELREEFYKELAAGLRVEIDTPALQTLTRPAATAAKGPPKVPGG